MADTSAMADCRGRDRERPSGRNVLGTAKWHDAPHLGYSIGDQSRRQHGLPDSTIEPDLSERLRFDGRPRGPASLHLAVPARLTMGADHLRHAAPDHRRNGVRPATAIVVGIGEAVVVIVVGATFVAVSDGFAIPITTFLGALGTLSVATVGGFLIVKAQGNIVGWLLWLSGLLLAVAFGAGYIASEGLTVKPGSIAGAIWFAWLSAWIAAPGLLLLAGILPFYFPTGRPLSSRWGLVASLGLAIIGVGVVASAFGHLKAGTYPAGIDNPLAIDGLPGDLLAILGGIVYATFALIVFPVAVASLVVRYERSSEIERRQLKPFGVLAGVIVTALVCAFLGGGVFFWLVAIGGLMLLPVAIGFAVLRHGLYDIDRLISRTIGWAIVSVVLATVFVVVILVLQTALAQVTSSNTVAVATSTLVVFALFQPLRRRVQARVDRRFNRARYDAERTLAAFAGRLRDEVDLGQLRAEITGTVDRTVQPATVTVWLRR